MSHGHTIFACMYFMICPARSHYGPSAVSSVGGWAGPRKSAKGSQTCVTPVGSGVRESKGVSGAQKCAPKVPSLRPRAMASDGLEDMSLCVDVDRLLAVAMRARARAAPAAMG